MMLLFRHSRLLATALIIALIQAGSPMVAYAKMAKDNGLTQEVCSAQGMKKVVMDAAGVAHEVTGDAADHVDHCQLCPSGGPAPIAALISLHENARSPLLIPIGQTCHLSGSLLNTPPATGPPSGT